MTETGHVIPGDKRGGRERATALCRRMETEGLSLRKAAVAEGMSHATFLRMVRKDDELRIEYERAQEISREVEIDNLRQEAAEVMKTALQRGHAASSYVAAFNAKVNLVKWEAERREPKKYGNRLDVNHSGTIDIAARLAGARGRIVTPVEPLDLDNLIVEIPTGRALEAIDP